MQNNALKIAKQRNGELSRLYLTHRGEYMRFDNCDNQTITSYKAALEPIKKSRGFAA